MSLAKTLVKLGTWIESRFPEKITAAEVEGRIASAEESAAAAGRRALMVQEVCNDLTKRVTELEKKIDTFNSDMNKTKIMLLTQRQGAGR